MAQQTRSLLVLIFIFTSITLLGCEQRPPRWIVYYGEGITEQQLQGIDLAILEPENITPKKFRDVPTKFIGYVSVGEAEEYRSYWFDIAEKEYVVIKNPHWPKNHLIDIRSEAWQKILCEKIIPPIVNKGYHGLFLDTIDTAIYLEDLDPVKFKGSKAAMIEFIKRLRREFPELILIPNNGLEILMDYAREIDGLVVEDLYTRHDFATKTNLRTPEKDTQYKENILVKFANYYKKPVYNILYADSAHSPLGQYAIQRSKDKGYNWYLTTVDLMKIGTVQ